MKRSGKKRPGHLQLVETGKRSFKPAQFTPGMAMDIMVNMDGPRAAAWLIKSRKKSFHRAGLTNIEIFKKDMARNPPWFRIAIEFLKRRKATGTPKTKKWRVEEREDADRRVCTIFWLGWGVVGND